MKRCKYKRIPREACIEPEEFFMVQVPCYKCGTRTVIQIDKDDSFDRSEAEYWEERYEDLVGSVNTLISDTEHRTGWNPHKEVFLRKLIAIRDKLSRDDKG